MLRYDESFMRATAKRLNEAFPDVSIKVGLNLLDDSFFLLVNDGVANAFGVSPRDHEWDEALLREQLRHRLTGAKASPGGFRAKPG